MITNVRVSYLFVALFFILITAVGYLLKNQSYKSVRTTIRSLEDENTVFLKEIRNIRAENDKMYNYNQIRKYAENKLGMQERKAGVLCFQVEDKYDAFTKDDAFKRDYLQENLAFLKMIK